MVPEPHKFQTKGQRWRYV